MISQGKSEALAIRNRRLQSLLEALCLGLDDLPSIPANPRSDRSAPNRLFCG